MQIQRIEELRFHTIVEESVEESNFNDTKEVFCHY